MHKLTNHRQEEQQFCVEKAPRRNSYRRVGPETKRDLVSLYLSKGLKISELSKRYHLSYATVAHIIKTKASKGNPPPEKTEEIILQVKKEDNNCQFIASTSTQAVKQKQQEGKKYPFSMYPFLPYYFLYPLK